MVRVVNTNVQSPVPLSGRGYTQRDSKDYGSGEFPQLNNVFVTDRGLESRHGIVSLSPSMYSGLLSNSKYWTDLFGFIGTHVQAGKGVFVASGKNAYFGGVQLGNGSTYVLQYFDPETVLAAQTNVKFNVPIKAFTYQDRNITITMSTTTPVATITNLRYHWGQQASDASVPAWNLIVDRAVPAAGAPAQDFVDAFAWKDRLWLVTRDTIYFSGIGTVANHQNFTAPVGGFIKYPGRIKAVERLKDSLYVICETEVYVFTYNIDPNTDAVNVAVSTTQGGDSSCIHEGTVYFTDGISLFTVSSGGVQEVMKLELFTKELTPGNWNNLVVDNEQQVVSKMVSYRNKIVLMFYDMGRIGGGGAPPTTTSTPYLNRGVKIPVSSRTDASTPTDPEVFNDSFSEFSNTFMIDMKNGSITKINFRDQREDVVNGFNGYIVDAISITDVNGNQNLYFMTASHRAFASSVSAGTAIYNSTFNFIYKYLDESNVFYNNVVGHKSYDRYHATQSHTVATISTFDRVLIPFNVVFKKFVPDGAQYLMKKFRQLLVTGNLPENTNFNKYFTEQPPSYVYTTDVDVVNPNSQLFNPKPYRFPLNQRGRFVTFAFGRLSFAGANSASNNSLINGDVLLLEDVRVIWAYTGKPSINKVPTIGVGGSVNVS